jgi:hypothetical protein
MVNSTSIKTVLHHIFIDRTNIEFLGLSPIVVFCICDVLKVGAVYFLLLTFIIQWQAPVNKIMNFVVLIQILPH